MSGISGKNMLLKVGTGGTAVTIAKLKNTVVKFNNSAVDVSTKDDDGWGATLTGGGKRSVNITCDGIVVESTHASAEQQNQFIEDCLAGASIDYTLVIGNGMTISGKFISPDFTITGDVEGAVTFSTSLNNDGAVTVTSV